MSDHIFICYTPLHVLISKKIIELEGLNSYIFIYYYESDNVKIRYYFDQIASTAKKSFYVRKKNKLPHTIKTLVNLLFKVWKYAGKSHVIYTGNVKTMYSRFLIWALKTERLHTFDDGIGNVSGEGYFYNDLEPTVYSRLSSLIGINFSYSAIYKLIRRHYTINDRPNIMPYSRHIKLFDINTMNQTVSDGSCVSVLLTSTLHEAGFLDLEHEKKLYIDVIKYFNVKYVIPHPLEICKKVEYQEVIIIESLKIAEEIIMDLMKEYATVKVIGWYSSVLIHLANTYRIEVINIHFETHLPLDKVQKFFEMLNIKTHTFNLQ
jgi:N-acetyllactosaminide alpha-2,3-sialyltransferase